MAVVFVLLLSAYITCYASSCKAYLLWYAMLCHCLSVDSSIILHSKSTVCLGNTLTFECRVKGGVSTVWKGSAFNCASSAYSIILLHSRYNDTNGTCSDGNIVAYAESLSIENDYYTSRINITVNSALAGSTLTITCIHDNGTKEELVESYSVAIENSNGSSICGHSNENVSLGAGQQSDMTGITCMQVPSHSCSCIS